MIGLLPVGDNPADPQGRPGVSFFWSIDTAHLSDWQNQPVEAFKAKVSKLWPKAGCAIAPLTQHSDFTPAQYYNGVCSKWSRGRVVVLGDAAHAMSPQLGQGANLALCDARDLANALADHAPIHHRVLVFEKTRKPTTRYYAFMSWVLTPFFQSGSKIIGPLRDFIFGVGCRLPIIRNWMAWTLAGRGRTPF